MAIEVRPAASTSSGVQLLLLAVAMAAGGYARTAVSPLQESMRVALELSDNQMALLQGPALGLPLLIAAIPLGLLIDRQSRARLLWSLSALNLVASLATVFAPTFALLVVARSIVGLAAFAVVPVVMSLLSDLYAPALRGRVTTAISLGQVGGNSAAFALGGQALAVYGTGAEGWRHAMFALAVPLAIAVLLLSALREPARTGVVIQNPSAGQSLTELWSYRGVVAPVLIGFIFIEIAIGAQLVWAAPALTRLFVLSPERVGTMLSMALLLSGTVGALAGGLLADFCERWGGPRRTITVMGGLAACAAVPASFLLAPVPQLASALLALTLTITVAVAVMSMTLLTVVIPNELRGLCSTLSAAVNVFFAVAVAPLLVSVLAGSLGEPDSIDEALTVVGVGACIAAALAFICGRTWFPPRLAPVVTGVQ